MPPTTSRLLRVVLRLIVLVQLASLGLVVFTLYELVTYGAEVTPGSVLLTTAMVASTLVALRATFRVGIAARGHRLVFMSAQALVALLPMAGSASLVGIAAPGSLMPPNDVYGSEFVLGMMALELLFAAGLAAISAIAAPVLLAPSPQIAGGAGGPAVSGSLALWLGAAAAATAAVYVPYAAHYRELLLPATQVRRLLTSEEQPERVVAAQHLVNANLDKEPEVRATLFDALEAPGVSEQAWAAYVLIAADVDDGRAMTKLRAMAGTFAVTTAMQSFAWLGAASAPALPEIARFIRQPTEDKLVAGAQIHAADALSAIGPPAIVALPSLEERSLDVRYPELRFAVGRAIDHIDPGFAGRCATGVSTMIDALANTNLGPLELRPECIPGKQPKALPVQPKA